MLSKLLPGFFKRAIKTHIRTIAANSGLYLRSFPIENAYCLKPGNSTANPLEGGKLPIPPKELWLGYAPDAQTYISFGERHVTDMIRALEKNGFSIGGAKRI